MRYIKSYENVKYFYNPPVIGEYYLVMYANDFYKAQLVAIVKRGTIGNKYLFDVLFDLDKDYFYTDEFSSNYIERELTPSEIEIYKMKKEADKYNL